MAIIRRQSPPPPVSSMSTTTIILIAVAAAFFALFISGLLLRLLRKRYHNPRYIPTEVLKDRWRRWTPRSRSKYTVPYQQQESVPTLYLNRSAVPSAANVDEEPGIGRNTSVRSVMTLPAYSRTARDNERILGREGERGGIDVVVENPETAEEEEDRRDEEMESLYQIRQQRRQENAEREERRRQRHEARAAGDVVTLRRLRQESALRAQERETTGAMAMILEHQSKNRERRVSSVSYGDLGVARHDGTRIRAGSASSDRQPLLDSAASISGQFMQPAVLRDSLSIHTRGRSAGSIMSAVSSEISDSELEAPPFGRSGSDFEVVTLSQLHSRNASMANTPGNRSRASSAARPSVDTNIPSSNPPEYTSPGGFEEAPPYVSPATERARQAPPLQTGPASLPQIMRLPSIRMTEATPIEPRRTEQFPPF